MKNKDIIWNIVYFTVAIGFLLFGETLVNVIFGSY